MDHDETTRRYIIFERTASSEAQRGETLALVVETIERCTAARLLRAIGPPSNPRLLVVDCEETFLQLLRSTYGERLGFEVDQELYPSDTQASPPSRIPPQLRTSTGEPNVQPRPSYARAPAPSAYPHSRRKSATGAAESDGRGAHEQLPEPPPDRPTDKDN